MLSSQNEIHYSNAVSVRFFFNVRIMSLEKEGILSQLSMFWRDSFPTATSII